MYIGRCAFGKRLYSWVGDRLFRTFCVVLVLLLLLQYTVNITLTRKYYYMTDYLFQANLSELGAQQTRLISQGTFRFSDGMLKFAIKHQRRLRAFLSMDSTPPPLCPQIPPGLVGPVEVTFDRPSYEDLEGQHPDVLLGGMWRPHNCTARHHVAIIVPFRDRHDHLNMFLNYIHPFLQKQQIDYGIYVVEQDPSSPFNRGMLLNIGYREALQDHDYPCFIFHDVDLLPENDHNIYGCPTQPRHMSAAVDEFMYRLPYPGLFGGVEAFRKEHFELVNGFSNCYFGWGAEDDDLSRRVEHHGLNLTRYPMYIARYRMLRHLKREPSQTRYRFLDTSNDRFGTDGINSLKYVRKRLERKKLYTLISVVINQTLIWEEAALKEPQITENKPPDI